MTTEGEGTNGHSYDEIPLRQLFVSDPNVRHREVNADIDQLAQSMRRYKLQQPIVVQEKGTDSDGLPRYEIIIGQRRFLAAQGCQ